MSGAGNPDHAAANFGRGDAVAIRNVDEILATLDANAKRGGLPFMPEMTPHCGKTFRVLSRAEKTCVEGTGLRRLKNAVLLDGLRCDGSAHDGCQRGCLFFWNEAWLKEGEGLGTRDWGLDERPMPDAQSPIPNRSALPTTKDGRYFCQSTELGGATTELAPGKLRYYLRDLRLGEITLQRFAYVIWVAIRNRLWRLLRGRGYYQLSGEQKKTLNAELNLQPGELVEIKSRAEIEATLDAQGRNRGLSFEPEMALLCGRRFRVAGPLHKIICEENGKMLHLHNTVILEGLVCRGIWALNCPRANYPDWREIWLKRV